MSDLMGFLLERIAEKEAFARRAIERRNAEVLATASAFGQSFMVVGDPLDPRQMLAECEATRRIVELHHEYLGVCAHCVDAFGEHQRAGWPCPTLRILATTYSDHPRFREEWRP